MSRCQAPSPERGGGRGASSIAPTTKAAAAQKAREAVCRSKCRGAGSRLDPSEIPSFGCQTLHMQVTVKQTGRRERNRSKPAGAPRSGGERVPDCALHRRISVRLHETQMRKFAILLHFLHLIRCILSNKGLSKCAEMAVEAVLYSTDPRPNTMKRGRPISQAASL